MSFRVHDGQIDLTDSEPAIRAVLGLPYVSLKPQVARQVTMCCILVCREAKNPNVRDLLFTHDLSGSDCTTTPASSAKRAVEGDLLQGTLENREFLIVKSRNE